MSARTADPTEPDAFMTPEWMQQRADDLASMAGHTMMRNSGMLDDESLVRFLEDAEVQGEGDGFAGFSILFGFDVCGRDFLIVRSEAEGGPHFISMAENGWAQ